MLYIVSQNPANNFAELLANHAIEFKMADSLAAVLPQVNANDAVAVLNDNYPCEMELSNDWQHAAQNGTRFFFEFPRTVAGIDWTKELFTVEFERTVAAKDFGNLKAMTIMVQNGCYFHKLNTKVEPILTAARVAGYRTAIYGLPEEHTPVCFIHPDYPTVMIGNANFSGFRTARFNPQPDWAEFLRGMIQFLQPKLKVPTLSWQMAVRPMYQDADVITAKQETEAFQRNRNFLARTILANYHNTGLLVDEGFSAQISYDGSQLRRQLTRGDCTGEVAMVFALDYFMTGNVQSKNYAERILNFLFTSDTLICLNKELPTYGQLNFFEHTPAFYGDDNFRSVIGAMASGFLLKTDAWNEPILRNFLSILRTTGKNGFRRDRLDYPASFTDGNDLAFYQNEDFVLLRPHAQAYLFAGFLAAYQLCGLPRFLSYAKNAIYTMMKAYPKVNWTNGQSQEVARMLLPLAWLIQVEDTPEHREMLERVVSDIRNLTQSCGAIAESMGDLSMGDFPSPQSNEAYGTTEAALIQENGDPACDLLYTVNYAAIGLHEAALATGNADYAALSDKLAKFLCKIQIKSDEQKYLDGCWMRGFDWTLWDYYGSSADAGWGAWCVESGWTNNWVSTMLALRKLNTSLWSMFTPNVLQPKLADIMAELEMTE